ncbi:MAG: oxidoreductase [Alphaproteobacteria bacterium]|nr:oxidoreductase [Alphaproteobacteria bacterium]
MSSLAPVLALAAPLCLAGAAVLAGTEPGRRPALALKAGTLGTVAALAAAVLAATFLLLGGFDLGPIVPFTVPVHLDALSAVMLVLVTFLGTIIVGFSRNYLDGDERQGLFIAWLCLTLAAVALLVIAGNLFILVGAWIATSLALHRLLTFYRGRRLAMAAAGKKFITARAGDVCLITAAILLYLAFGSADMGVILDTAERIGAGEAGGLVTWAGFLIAFAAILKSAQFPTHGWLLEVMETPTPVSALLHAGVVNAGGFLVLRFADVMVLAAGTLPLLAIVGAATAVIGSAVMLRQSSVKVALAWSTIAQMGFMLLQCGLGAFSLAALHIVAHSLYKAHAFLASGSAVDLARSEHPVRTGASPSVRIFLPVLVAALAAGYGVAAVAGLDLRADAGELALGAILVMALSILFSRQLTVGSSAALFARLTLLAGAVSAAYLVLHTVAFWVMGSALPPAPEQGPVALLIQALIVFSFMTLTIAQVCGYLGTGSRSPRGFAVHLANGFYANAWFDRIVGSYRLTGSGQR